MAIASTANSGHYGARAVGVGERWIFSLGAPTLQEALASAAGRIATRLALSSGRLQCSTSRLETFHHKPRTTCPAARSVPVRRGSWMGWEKDLPPGEKLVACFRPFIEHLASSSLSRKTIRRYIDNLWIVGGEIIREDHAEKLVPAREAFPLSP